jgi:hypothetical protein
LDGAADDVGIAEIVALPEFVCKDDDGLRFLAWRRVRGDQPTAHDGWNAPMVGSVGRKVDGPYVFGKVAVGGGEIPVVLGDDAFDGLGLADLVELWTVEAGVAIIAGFIFQAGFHDAVGAGVGEWIDKNSVDDAEYSACGADSQGEGEDGGQGEARVFAELASGEAEVGEEGWHGHLAGLAVVIALKTTPRG